MTYASFIQIGFSLQNTWKQILTAWYWHATYVSWVFNNFNHGRGRPSNWPVSSFFLTWNSWWTFVGKPISETPSPGWRVFGKNFPNIVLISRGDKCTSPETYMQMCSSNILSPRCQYRDLYILTQHTTCHIHNNTLFILNHSHLFRQQSRYS